MRVAFFSPLPPKKSGIADYSAALLLRLAEHLDLEVFVEEGCAETSAPAGAGRPVRPCREFQPAQFDAAVYQVGNNPDHLYLYRFALEHPGVTVLHEFNLHHLIAAATISQENWEAYLEEAAYNAGEAALARARRAQALEAGPDYDLPMNRRLLERSRGIIVHSRYMADLIRSAGFPRPVAVIPHGATAAEVNRQTSRRRLGVDETTPLIGVFGFLKPYKRIHQTLRAYQRLLRVEPRARLILVGEEHPELPLRRLIASLGLEAHARVLGYASPEDFEGYLAAVDICVNLQYPTAGESSGTVQRAMGLRKPMLVSDLGSFAELPDDACLKVPVDDAEVGLIFEYLNLLISRPAFARAIGDRARSYIAEECSWKRVASDYAAFLQALAEGREWARPPRPRPPERVQVEAAAPPEPQAAAPEPHPWLEYILGYARSSREQLEYVRTHATRLLRTLEITPRGGPEDRVLEMGAYLQITPALQNLLGYGEVRGCYLGPAGRVDHREVRSSTGEVFRCEIDLFDAEKERFPYPDGHFATVLCCELLEHLREDPMHMMAEINRILRPGGSVVLTTPNICSLRAIDAILLGYHPGFFHQYIRSSADGVVEPGHHREYAPREVELLLDQAGFEPALLETGPFRAEPSAAGEWVLHLLDRYSLPKELRGEGIYAVGCKRGPVKNRYPRALYAEGGA